MVGSLGELINDWQKGVTDFTREGKCSNCGQCCSDFLPVSADETKKIKGFIKDNGIKECVNRPPTIMPTVDMTCPFRDEMRKKCTIYAVRPKVCRKFICNAPQSEAEKLLFSKSRRVISMRKTFFGGKK